MTLQELLKLIDAAHVGFKKLDATLWEACHLPQPELWQQDPWGYEGCGFWVVAVAGRRCIYYNDIHRGFCSSEFTRWGRIDSFSEQPDHLQSVLVSLTKAEALA
ncbi:MAG: hypothetical protein P1U57_07985 [Oleibacter sp.]|nr:hypothetical protein [Thalassolituus sp.]